MFGMLDSFCSDIDRTLPSPQNAILCLFMKPILDQKCFWSLAMPFLLPPSFFKKGSFFFITPLSSTSEAVKTLEPFSRRPQQGGGGSKRIVLTQGQKNAFLLRKESQRHYTRWASSTSLVFTCACLEDQWVKSKTAVLSSLYRAARRSARGMELFFLRTFPIDSRKKL